MVWESRRELVETMKINDRTAIIERPQIHIPSPVREQWEHRSQRMEIDADLSQFGSEGWQLVSVAILPHDPSMAMYYFRRRRL
jgi:hypothetical protein